MLQEVVNKCGICTRKGKNNSQTNANAISRSNAEVIHMINLCPQQSQVFRHVECSSCSSDTDVHQGGRVGGDGGHGASHEQGKLPTLPSRDGSASVMTTDKQTNEIWGGHDGDAGIVAKETYDDLNERSGSSHAKGLFQDDDTTFSFDAL